MRRRPTRRLPRLSCALAVSAAGGIARALRVDGPLDVDAERFARAGRLDRVLISVPPIIPCLAHLAHGAARADERLPSTCSIAAIPRSTSIARAAISAASNSRTIKDDVLAFQPDRQYDLICSHSFLFSARALRSAAIVPALAKLVGSRRPSLLLQPGFAAGFDRLSVPSAWRIWPRRRCAGSVLQLSLPCAEADLIAPSASCRKRRQADLPGLPSDLIEQWINDAGLALDLAIRVADVLPGPEDKTIISGEAGRPAADVVPSAAARSTRLLRHAREQHAYTIHRLLTSLRSAAAASGVHPHRHLRLFALRRAPIANYVFTDLHPAQAIGFEIDADETSPRAWSPPIPRFASPTGRTSRRVVTRCCGAWNCSGPTASCLAPGRGAGARRISRLHPARTGCAGAGKPAAATRSGVPRGGRRLRAEGKALTGRIAVQYLSARRARQAQEVWRLPLRRSHRAAASHGLGFVDCENGRDRLGRSDHRGGAGLCQQSRTAEQLLKVFDLAEIDFGRIDCISNAHRGVRRDQHQSALSACPDHRRQPHVPPHGQGIIDGFRGLDPPNARRGLARFRTPAPKLERLRSRSLGRRLMDWMTFWRWRTQHGPSLARAKRRKPVA